MKHTFIWTLIVTSSALACHVQDVKAQNTPVSAGLHFAISTEISFATCMFITLKYPKKSLTNKCMISGAFGTLVGVGKELPDLSTHNDFDIHDEE
jgi:hypothetical protein